jgi:hypothetical protein
LIASPSVKKLAITTTKGPLITSHTIRTRHQGVVLAVVAVLAGGLERSTAFDMGDS